ncbi:hypothetical protein MNBD_GAMMA09-2578 [hydrothermal vent metagenome]|uniref:DUF6316 domain-containing protein n=1 Tax=hydrothermal vent metagenome TaxID=652676 RepID=A0A3B0XPD4_9ZZZZ
MQHHRYGEEKSIPFRTERYFCSNGVWYFDTRGGHQKGPYISKQEMQAELMQFIQEQITQNKTLKR